MAGIGQLDLFRTLFEHIHIVQEVADECAAGGRILVPDLNTLSWIKIVESSYPVLPGLMLDLDKGEKHTLDMAKKLSADWVIIDERIARSC